MTNELQELDISTLAPSEEARIELVEKEFLKQPQVECAVTHRFGPGVYIREVKIPAGTWAIGHHQNFEHQNILLQGRVSIRNEDGTVTEMKAPAVFVGKPGRKIGFIHEEMIWLNVYATNETDVEKLEATYLSKSASWTQAYNNLAQLCSNIDRADFEFALVELGVTKEQVREQSEKPDDQTNLPNGAYKFKVGKSNIEGRGLLATGNFINGEKIAPARIAGKRTICGRFTNHSKNPNARMVQGNGSDIDLIAIRNIEGCHGGLDGEEITIDYREAFKLTVTIGKG